MDAAGPYHSLISHVVHKYPLIGMSLTTHRNTRGKPMSFKNRPYLVEMYRDFPNIEGADVRKAVQTGLSELFIQLILHSSGHQSRIAAYVLPTYTIRDRFVQQRINPLMQQVPAYRVLAGLDDSRGRSNRKPGNLKLKRFGNGAMMFLGSNTAGDFLEFSADTLIVDEFDQCDPQNLAKARDRLRASDEPQMFRLGNPTLPRTGISRLFDATDQRQWFHKCDRCNTWQAVDWFKSVVRKNDQGNWELRDRNPHSANDPRPVCVKCHQPFDRRKHTGAWVAKNREAERRGYTISRLDVLNESFKTLFAEWIESQTDQAKLSTFYTSVLGRPFEHTGARVTHQMLADAATGDHLDYVGDDSYRNRIITMGVDVGTVLNVSISAVEHDPETGKQIRRAVWVGAVRSFEEVEAMFSRYHVDVCVIDAMPETRKAKELRDNALNSSTRTSVWLCRFHPTPRVGAQKYGMRQNWQERVISVDRTQVMDATFDDIQNGGRVWPEDIFTVLGWADQMRASVRVLDEAKSRIAWVEGSAADHYRFADVYDRIAFDIGESAASYIG